MRKSIIRFVVILLALCLLLTPLAGCQPKKPQEEAKVIKIAVCGPMQHIQGEHHWLGADLAAKEINAAGGVKVGEETYTVQLVKVDTNEIFDPGDAVTAVEKAITSDKVHFLIGGFRTEAVMPYTELAAKDHKKIFMICGAATNELLAGRVDKDYDTWKYLFRVTPIRSTDLVKVSILMTADVAAAIRRELGIMQPKIAILAEKLEWNRALVQMAPVIFKDQLKLDYIGTWEPSATATDVTTELRAIEAAGAHIIYTIMSGPVGIPYARLWGELEIPACSVGINVEAQKFGFWEATQGHGNYDYTLNTYAKVQITEHTIPFVEKFTAAAGQPPVYTAGTYDAVYMLVEAVERAGSLDSDAVVVELEKTDRRGAVGRFVFDNLHDVTWGPGYVTGIGVQWQDGEMVCTWPNEWKPDPVKAPNLVVTYPGSKPYVIPPRVIERFKQ